MFKVMFPQIESLHPGSALEEPSSIPKSVPPESFPHTGTCEENSCGDWLDAKSCWNPFVNHLELESFESILFSHSPMYLKTWVSVVSWEAPSADAGHQLLAMSLWSGSGVGATKSQISLWGIIRGGNHGLSGAFGCLCLPSSATN